MSDRFAWGEDDVDLEELDEAELDRLGLIQVPEVLTESRPLAEAVATSTDNLGRRQRLLLISEGWGSSGYYSADLLRQVSHLFEAGTHQYIDHPSRSENDDRPERSLRDLAAVLATTAQYDPATRGLYAVSDVFPAYRQFLAEMKDYIGVSIRASGTVEYGEAEGREGPIVTSITAVESVDFVTRAGRGGRIVELLESARAQALEERGNWREEDHPRGFHGRFGHGGGGGSSQADHSGGGGHGGSSGGHSGAGPGGASPSRERGMPKTLATAEVPLKNGGTITIGRQHDGDRISLTHGDHSTSLNRDKAHKLASTLELADDWDTGDEENIDGAGHIRKTGPGAYDVTLPDGTKLGLTRRDAVKIDQALQGLDSSSRIDTGAGDLDVFSPGRGKIGYRHLGDDGRPVEVVFDRKSYNKISGAIDQIIDDVDFPPDNGKPITRRVVSTNQGKVSVELFGKWGGQGSSDRLEILPVGHDDWGMVVNGPHQRDWSDANDKIMTESADAAPPGVSLVEAKVSDTPWSEFRQGDYDIGQWRRACLLAPDEPSDSKADYGLPVREPDGTLNRAAVHAAASRINQVKADPGVRRAAAGRLVKLYGQLGEDPPAGLLDLAGTRKITTKESAMRDPYASPEQPANPTAVEAVRRLAEAAGITANDLRDALTDAVRDVYSGDVIHVWVRDWTDEWVVFSMEDNLDPSGDLFQQTYTLSGRTVTLTGDPTPVRAVTTYEPQPEPEPEPSGEPDEPTKTSPPTTKTEPGAPPATMKEGNMPEITEEQARQLAEAATIKTSLEEAISRLNEAGTQIAQLRERADAADARAEQADALARALQNTETARTLMAEALTEAGGSIPAASHKGLTAAVLRDLPVTEAGTLDRDAFNKLAEAAITDKRTEIAGLLEEAGVGTVRGLGQALTDTTVEEATAEQITTNLIESYTARGMSPEAARLAAAGRPF